MTYSMTHWLVFIFAFFKIDIVAMPENRTVSKSETWIISIAILNFERLPLERRLICRFLSLTIDIESQTKNFSMRAVGTFDIESSSRSLKSLIRPFLVINHIYRFCFGLGLGHFKKYSSIYQFDFLRPSQKTQVA